MKKKIYCLYEVSIYYVMKEPTNDHLEEIMFSVTEERFSLIISTCFMTTHNLDSFGSMSLVSNSYRSHNEQHHEINFQVSVFGMTPLFSSQRYISC